jgi:hypothetical protein
MGEQNQISEVPAVDEKARTMAAICNVILWMNKRSLADLYSLWRYAAARGIVPPAVGQDRQDEFRAIIFEMIDLGILKLLAGDSQSLLPNIYVRVLKIPAKGTGHVARFPN